MITSSSALCLLRAAAAVAAGEPVLSHNNCAGAHQRLRGSRRYSRLHPVVGSLAASKVTVAVAT